MKKLRRLAALMLVLVLAVSLFSGCSLIEQETEAEPEQRNDAVPGGSISWPEGFDTSERFTQTQAGGVLYTSFNGIQDRTSDYFTPASDTVTIVGQATTESEKRKTFRVTLWKEGTESREYVAGGTLYLQADGSCYTGTFSNLDPASRYKIGLAYDGGNSFYMTGGVTVSGIA